jgi:hypothetical protein
MKKTLTIALILGLTTVASAQLLMRTETTKDKKGSYEKQIFINLDTMPHIQYLTVWFEVGWATQHGVVFHLGDGSEWRMINENNTLMRIRDKVALFNRMYAMNWVFQMPLSSISIDNGKGDTYTEWLFKRKETK